MLECGLGLSSEQLCELGIAVVCIFEMSWELEELHHQYLSPCVKMRPQPVLLLGAIESFRVGA